MRRAPSRTRTYVLADRGYTHGRTGKFTDGCIYVRMHGRMSGSIHGPGKGAGYGVGKQREVDGGAKGCLSRDGREKVERDVERDGSLGDCCAVATSLVVEASRVHPTGMLSLFLPLSPLPSVPSCSISCQPSHTLPLRYYCRLRSSTLSNLPSRSDQSPFLPFIPFSPIPSLAFNPRSHPVSPTMLPVSLSRRVALQKQAYGYPQ